MSRIGKKIISAAGVTLSVSPANEITVKGPKGELKQVVDRDIKVELVGDEIHVLRPTDQIRHKALHGLYRSLVANMVAGVTTGFQRNLELVGVGYRATVTGQLIDMALDRGVTEFFNGMALGIDQLAAEVLIERQLHWTAVIPCQNQDRLWTLQQKLKYQELLKSAFSSLVANRTVEGMVD
jgi:hypothetical protein